MWQSRSSTRAFQSMRFARDSPIAVRRPFLATTATDRRPRGSTVLFTGPEIEELRDAMTDAFDESALEQTVLFKLGKVLFNIVAHEDFNTVTYKFIILSENEGWVRSLDYAVVLVRPSNEKAKAFCSAHATWA